MVRHRTDAHLRQIAIVSEQLALEEQLLGDLLSRAGGQRAAR